MVFFSVTDTTGLSTTGAENLSACFQWGSVPGATSFVANVCRISRVA